MTAGNRCRYFVTTPGVPLPSPPEGIPGRHSLRIIPHKKTNHMKNLLYFSAVMLLLTAAKCKDKVTFQIGQPFQLKVEQGAMSDDKSFGVMVDKIKEDSRCPKGVNCVWEGQVVVQVTFKEKGGKSQTVDFTLKGRESQSASRRVTGKYQLRVKQVDPYPEDGKTIAKEDYAVTFLASEIKDN